MVEAPIQAHRKPFTARAKEGIKRSATRLAEIKSGQSPQDGIHTFKILRGANQGLWFSTMQPEQSFALGSYEPEVSHAIDSLVKPRSIFFDVGANVGWDTLIAANNGARVIAFEPGASNLPLLSDTIHRNGVDEQVKIEPIGIGEKTEVIQFAEYPNYGLVNHVITSENPAKPDAVISEINITSIDDYASAHNLIPNVIKIDIEGHEFAALKGAQKTFGTHKPSVICEVRPDNWEEIRTYMDSMGYDFRFLGGNGRGLATAGLDDALFTPRKMA